ncbi:hypothetical protein KTN05_01970 [Paracoccus sp. Z118]|uniref:hypothetical protein n=1 Tax=Paracoccus sp. Z118 TaxID=2851017 RepID=UPI001C2B98E0|nr:hypothetical protein [Paracoccus sp. Z118]MBV0890615.1 hypothetical protein [Paracoccus sp. Z118]
MIRRPIPTALRAAIPATILLLAACGDPQPARRTTTTTQPPVALVDPAALYCAGTGGTVIQRIENGRRADLCRQSNGRTVRTADLINAHNDL